jgi:hypothetical protein
MVHESALNDLWNQVGGRPWPDPALQSEAVTTLVRDTSSSRSTNPFDFATKSPVHWVLGTNRVTARVNVEDEPETSGETATFEASYSLPVAAKALELVRDVSLDRLEFGSAEKNEDQGAAELVRQTVEKMFPPTLDVAQLLPGLESDDAPSGELVVSRQLVDNGWLLLGWSRGTPSVAAAP